jgi:hypothetical protein
MRARRNYRWTDDLLDAVAECVRRYGAKRAAAMLGLDYTAIRSALHRHGTPIMQVKRAPRLPALDTPQRSAAA